jgi:transposase-like protein
MDDDSAVTVTGSRRRRKHTDAFRAEVVRAAQQPGVSVASVALKHALNANLVRRWVVASERAAQSKSGGAGDRFTQSRERALDRAAALRAISQRQQQTQQAGRHFVPLAVASPVAAATEPAGQIQIELSRGATSIRVSWPLAAADECAAWLRQWIR